MSTPTSPEHAACPSWCNAHYTDDDEGYPIHKRVVTVGEASVEIETSPEWDDGLPIVPPQWNECDASAARDLAAALIEAAQLIEDEQP